MLLETYIRLPPGRPTQALATMLAERVISQYEWVEPKRVGPLSTDIPVTEATAVRELLKLYANGGGFAAKGRGGEFHLNPPRERDVAFLTGYLGWYTKPASYQRDEAERLEQTVALAKLVGSPLCWIGLDDIISDRSRRIVRNGNVSEGRLRVRDYRDGLLCLSWRNIFGPLFTAMFGRRLEALPAGQARDLGEGYWLVQPYATPEQGLTEEGQRREAEVIAAIGQEFFYDFAREERASRKPAVDLRDPP